MTRSIERLVWRHEYGKLAVELLDIEMRDALDRLGQASLELTEEHASAIRLWDAALLHRFSDAYRAAMDAVATLRYRQALRRMHECERTLDAMRELLAAVKATDAAEEAALALHELAAVPRLQHLPAVASTAQIVDLARQTIIEGHRPRAVAIARTCSRMALRLLEKREPNSGERAAFEEACLDIEALCHATRAFAPGSGDPAADGSLEQVAGLLAEGYAHLASRLLTELQIDLSGRRRFLRLYERKEAAALQFGPDEEVRAAIDERSWDGAVDYYWGVSVAGHAGVIEMQKRRIEAATAAVEEAMTAFATNGEGA